MLRHHLMEMHNRRFEMTEGEDLIRARMETALNTGNDRDIFQLSSFTAED